MTFQGIGVRGQVRKPRYGERRGGPPGGRGERQADAALVLEIV
jgi:hypothetical protein